MHSEMTDEDDKLLPSVSESTTLIPPSDAQKTYQSVGSDASSATSTQSGVNGTEYSMKKTETDTEANILSERLLACGDNSVMEGIVLQNSFSLGNGGNDDEELNTQKKQVLPHKSHHLAQSPKLHHKKKQGYDKTMVQRVIAMFSLAVLGLMIIVALLQIGTLIVGPPSQPIGPYRLKEIQEGQDFFNHYSFYSGKDSEGSNGFINYVNRDEALRMNIANVTYETVDTGNNTSKTEPFVYMSTSPTDQGPRNSVRLEGLKRYNHGLFILDVRHMPAGCSSWPAFWLTDEPNWPVNGEIDILEGVNAQTVVKTALHSTMQCKMDDVPMGVKTGNWDTAVGVPQKNGDLDMTVREANDCYVYNPHQWLNQGCVAMSEKEGTIGEPLNKKGGGVFVLEWDPVNKHMSSFVFTPHGEVPENLKETLRTASETDPAKRVKPDPKKWGLPYAYFPIGKATQCSSDHFSNMHLIFNMALCGSVAGNRFFMDCPELNEKYGNCDNFVAANTPEMNEMYWKVRGVYVYEREWERAWVS